MPLLAQQETMMMMNTSPDDSTFPVYNTSHSEADVLKLVTETSPCMMQQQLIINTGNSATFTVQH